MSCRNVTSQPTLFPHNVLLSRAGRFGTKGLAITFVSSEGDQQVMDAIQARFEVAMTELPDSIDPASYSESFLPPSSLKFYVLNYVQ